MLEVRGLKKEYQPLSGPPVTAIGDVSFRVEARGHEVVAISRSRGVDIVSGQGLADALAGVDVIVDAATGPSPDQQAATDFFTAATRNLQQAGHRAARRPPPPVPGVQQVADGLALGAEERLLRP